MLVLITPPLVQLNTPYTATPVLTHGLRQRGHDVQQRDFSLATALRVFTPRTIDLLEDAARKIPHPDDAIGFLLESADDYRRTVTDVIAFLQGRRPELAWPIAARNLLPEGPAFQELWVAATDDDDDSADQQLLLDAFGRLGTAEQAKYLASLYLDDLTAFIQRLLDPDFGFGSYAASLAISLPTLDPLLQRLEAPPTFIDAIIDQLTQQLLDDLHPTAVGLAVPFPGTLYAAFRIARAIRRLAPQTTLILGGGYVNSELRSLEDPRVFDFFDYLTFDEGLTPLDAILSHATSPLTPPAPDACPTCAHPRILSANGPLTYTPAFHPPALLVPTYDGLNLDDYLGVLEFPNPIQRLWSDGHWLKMQLAQGCYWHKCAFCDLALDYIGRYEPASPTDIADAIQHLIQTTGHCGFHFVDEALSPALLAGLSRELIRRNLHAVWWGNVRFDNAFTPELAQLMADAGCIAVTGGLECAHDRLLKLMNKGITLASARRACQAFADAHIMVHAYLMYAFPTETEKEALDALAFVRKCFADGLIQSAHWHRFALTAHSAIAQRPHDFGIDILPTKTTGAPRFALNEIDYREPNAPDWNRIGHALETAVYNYRLGLGLDLPPRAWLHAQH